MLLCELTNSDNTPPLSSGGPGNVHPFRRQIINFYPILVIWRKNLCMVVTVYRTFVGIAKYNVSLFQSSVKGSYKVNLGVISVKL